MCTKYLYNLFILYDQWYSVTDNINKKTLFAIFIRNNIDTNLACTYTNIS